jgi:hypothetical protein
MNARNVALWGAGKRLRAFLTARTGGGLLVAGGQSTPLLVAKNVDNAKKEYAGLLLCLAVFFPKKKYCLYYFW